MKVKTDQGLALGANILALIKHNFGENPDARNRFAALFGMPAASIWPWTSGKRRGIPNNHRDRLEMLVRGGHLHMVPGTSISDYVREPARKTAEEKEPRINQDLLGLIWSVVRNERLGPGALEALMSDTNFLERKRTPALLFRWAYHEGGVPRSYHLSFTAALIRSGIAAELLGYTGPGDDAFEIRVTSFFAR